MIQPLRSEGDGKLPQVGSTEEEEDRMGILRLEQSPTVLKFKGDSALTSDTS
jgi:hypothetical protein